MKTCIFVLILILIAKCCNSQQIPMMFVSGMSDGFQEVITHHYSSFEKKHPNAKQTYWNPEVSWKNKYNSKIPFSESLTCWTTDAYHLNKSIRLALMTCTVVITIGDKKPFKSYLKEFVVYRVAYGVGFWLVWDVIY